VLHVKRDLCWVEGSTAAGLAVGLVVHGCGGGQCPPMTDLVGAAEAARLLGTTRGRVLELADSDPEFPTLQPSPAGGDTEPATPHQWQLTPARYHGTGQAFRNQEA
jgi:hypothetical protein